MRRLSLPIGQLKAHYDVVIVGSGYGGAVVASRIAARNGAHTVCILERGEEWHPGSYPDRLLAAVRQVQWHGPRRDVGRPSALYDFHYSKDLSVLVGCGLGGTSLINANVVLPPTDSVLQDTRWPSEVRNSGSLMAGFERARDMLRPEEYPRPIYPHQPVSESASAWVPLYKRDTIRETGRLLSPFPPGFGAATELTPLRLAVSFESRINHVGIQEKACNLCGNCVSGCNFSAKKTLIMNYLPDAKARGAEIFCGVAVRWLERRGVRWIVHFDLPNAKRERFRPQEMFVTADRVILSAGSLGSTEILLRSRARGLTMSEQVGKGFSGNADFIAFSYNVDPSVRAIGSRSDMPSPEASIGPTITSMVDARLAHRPGGVVIQDGAIPTALSAPLRFLFPIAARTVGTIPEWSPRARLKRWVRELEALFTGERRGALRNTQTLLVMGHEENTGQLVLERDRVQVKWPGVGSQLIFQQIKRLLYQGTAQLGGVLVKNPFWSRSFGRRLFTVHPLGGCVMGATKASGVVNHKGQVFDGAGEESVHHGLYVSDGSVIPVSLGANPLLTICAVAERAGLMISEEISGDRQAMPNVHPQPVRRDTRMPGVGVHFSERMTGTFTWAGDPTKSLPIEMILTANSENLDDMLRDSKRAMELVGTVRAPNLAGVGRVLTITEGCFNLFAEKRDRAEYLKLGYRMKLTSVDGRTFRLTGEKALHDDAWVADMVKDLTRMPIVLEELVGDRTVRRGEGSVQIARSEIPRIVTSVRVTGARSRVQRYRALLRFLRFYAGRVLHVYGWPIGTVDVFREKHAPNGRKLKFMRSREPNGKTRPLVRKSSDDITTADNAQIRLTRYVDRNRERDRGAVILAPGFGMSTYSFVVPTIDCNLTEYLVGLGYDVWLLDYRASEFTPSSRSQFSIDDIARYDFPKAVYRVIDVRREEKRLKPEPHVLGHCVGSIACLMALLRGYIRPLHASGDASADGESAGPAVRSLICSQSFTHVAQPRTNRIKAGLHLADVLQQLRAWPTLTSDFDSRSRLGGWIWDRILHFYPSRERCRNPVCRRNLFLYGQVVRHDQLNTETHNAMYDLFDLGNLTAMQQLQRIVAAGRIVDAKGKDNYLMGAEGEPVPPERLRLPIRLLQGMGNRLFYPVGGALSLAWLRENGIKKKEDELYRMDCIPRYGHLDLFVGRSAATDVFPVIARALAYNSAVSDALT